MPKIMTVKMSVPSGSRPDKLKIWLNDHLRAHRMEVIEVGEQPLGERAVPQRQSMDDFFKEVEGGN